MAISSHPWGRQRNKRIAVAILLLILVCLGSSSAFKCSDQKTVGYSNGKCFILHQTQKSWTEAKKECEIYYDRLAEPKTQESGDLLLHHELFASSIAYIGAFGSSVTGSRFASDYSSFQLQETPPPDDQLCANAQQCCVLKVKNSHWTEQACSQRSFFICEKGIEEFYVLPVLSARNTKDGYFNGWLEMLLKTAKVLVEITIHLHTSVETSELKSFKLFEINPVEWYFINITAENETSAIQTNCLTIKTSHPISLTFYATSFDVTFLMVPYITESIGINNPKFLVVSPGDIDIVNQLVIVSMTTQDATDVSLVFRFGALITVDNLQITSPNVVRATLNPYESVNIHGTFNMEGLTIRATEEVAVYVMTKELDPTTNTTLPPKVYQVIQNRVMSSNYVTFPSEAINTDPQKTDVYKLVSMFPETKITFNGEYRYMKYGRRVEMVTLPSNKFHYVKGDKLFKMYKVYSQSRNDLCFTPLIPEEIWRKDYRLGIKNTWMNRRPKVHFIMDGDATEQLTVNGKVEPLTCSIVEGHSNLHGCTLDVEDVFRRNLMSRPLFQFEMYKVFGAYLSWRFDGHYFCRRLGYKLIDVELEWVTESTSTELNLITIATAASTRVTISESTTIRIPVSATAEISSESTERFVSSPTNITNTTDTLNELTQTTTGSGEYNNSTDRNAFTSSSISDTMTTSETTSSYNSSIISSPTQTTPKDGTDFTNATKNETLACSPAKTLPTNLTVKELGELLTTIKKKLAVNTRETSSYVRKKTSAKDRRPSSQSMGYVGIFAIVLSLGIFVIADIVTCIHFILRLFSCRFDS